MSAPFGIPPNLPNSPDPDCDPSVCGSVWTQCAKRCKIPHFSLTERTYLTQKRGGFIEIYLTKQHEYTILQSFSEYFNGGCNLQPPLWFWGQIAFRMVFPIASAALCFISGVEWT